LVRRQGKWMHYRIAVPPHKGANNILHTILAALKEDKSMCRDRLRLSRMPCCIPQSVDLLHAASEMQLDDAFSKPRPLSERRL
jgi:ArsR family transcriptional regulator